MAGRLDVERGIIADRRQWVDTIALNGESHCGGQKAGAGLIDVKEHLESRRLSWLNTIRVQVREMTTEKLAINITTDSVQGGRRHTSIGGVLDLSVVDDDADPGLAGAGTAAAARRGAGHPASRVAPAGRYTAARSAAWAGTRGPAPAPAPSLPCCVPRAAS